MSTLEIIDLHVSIEDKQILKGVNLVMNTGEIHAIMGPNGTGKSTLSQAIMGHPSYTITKGQVLLDGDQEIGRKNGNPEYAGRNGRTLFERRLFRRRKETQRNPATDDDRTEIRDS